MRIPLASSGLREKDINLAIDVLKSGMLTMGAQVKEFEKMMSQYLGSQDFVMMNSGSSANLAMFEALIRPAYGMPKLNPGDGVLVPAIAWPTTVWPIVQLGLKPVFVDVDVDTLAMDLNQISDVISKSSIPVRAIFPIHPLGRSVNPTALKALADKHDLILLNDVCESLGSWSEGIHAGLSGIGSSFSFYFSHHITTMEGGGVATNDKSFADDLRSIRSHGWSRDRSDVSHWTENVTNNDAKFLFVTAGFNVRPMEIQAAIGKSQIADIDGFIDRRRQIAKTINSRIEGSNLSLIGSDTFQSPELEKSHSWMLMPIRVSGDNASDRKHEIVSILEEFEIETRPVLTGNFLDQPAMNKIYHDSPNPRDFPNADFVSATTFLIGAHHDLSDEQLNYLGEKLASVSHK